MIFCWILFYSTHYNRIVLWTKVYYFPHYILLESEAGHIATELYFQLKFTKCENKDVNY